MARPKEAPALMPPPTPLPARARAIIVGIESYELPGAGASLDALTRIPDLEGVVDDAWRLADSLINDLGFVGTEIDLWLSPAATTPASAPAGVRLRPFTETFDLAVTDLLVEDAAGGLLLLFWSGHGTIDDDNHLRLLLPGSSTHKPRSIDAEELCTLLIGSNVGHFSHQIVVFNACRTTAAASNIVGPLKKTPLHADPPDAGRPVVQLKVFGCSLAESARQPRDGAWLLRALRAGWKGAGRQPWPDFERLAQDAAARVAAESDEGQRPQVIGWSGQTLMAPAPTLRKLLGCLDWNNERFRTLALRCLRPNDPRERLEDLSAIIGALEDLAPARGVVPLHEFVARVIEQAGATAPTDLVNWFNGDSDANEQAEIKTRLQAEAPLHVLQLWVQDQPTGGGVSAALMDCEGRPLFTDWDIHTVRSFDAGDVGSLLLVMGDWVQEALARVDQPLLLELFLPTARLAAGIDGCTVTANGDDYALGAELPALLRAMDRHKSDKRRAVWTAKAQRILGRHVSSKTLLHWCDGPPNADLIRSEFADAHDEGAVWLALAAAPTALAAGATRVPGTFDHALDNGVPSVLWPRTVGTPAAPPRAALEQALLALLKNTASNLPRTLRAWREQHSAALRGEPALLLEDPARPPPWAVKPGRGGAAR